MRNEDENVMNQFNYLLTQGLVSLKITFWMISGEFIQLVQPFYHLIKVSPLVLNHIIQQL